MIVVTASPPGAEHSDLSIRREGPSPRARDATESALSWHQAARSSGSDRGSNAKPKSPPSLRPGRRSGPRPQRRRDAPQPSRYDIRSTRPDGQITFIEVKGRIAGAATFTVTQNELCLAAYIPHAHHGAAPERRVGGIRR
ncbi:MAG: DUF3883 domain-containing protein [Actinomycetota bacterium]|nr:DUF3883 domain-containing protein [Actinomycetota bacterium]